jgi:hypothetical protein
VAGERKLGIADFKPLLEREVFPVTWPGTDKRVGVLILRCAEVQESHFAARAHFAKKAREVDQPSMAEFSYEEDAQLCYRMLIDPEARVADARIFKSADEARGMLDIDERAFFVSEHQRLQLELARKRGLVPPEPVPATPDAGEEP